MNNRAKLIVPAIAAITCAPALAGGMQLDTDSRYRLYDLSGETSNFPPDFYSDFIEGPPPTSFTDWDYTHSAAIPDVQLDASHSSSVSSTALVAQGDIAATSTTGNFNYGGIFTVAAFNDYTIRFTLLTETSFDLDASLSASGQQASSSVMLRDLNSNTTVYTASTNDIPITIDESFTLAAGSYEFSLQANLLSFVYPYNASASYNGTLAVVPTPSVLTAIFATGFLTIRRRREEGRIHHE
ncbi:MAG: hypothetical protein KC996_08025 [Phycisphaerales bacterium]|nr:hypothetical protein [Phycisphaerales bacterium]